MDVELITEDRVGFTNAVYKLPDGRHHREDGPAYIRKYLDGHIAETWCHYGEVHRYGGPAVIRYYPGYFTQYDYYIHDRAVTASVNTWLDERDYFWEAMSDVEKWELDLFMRAL